MGFELGLIEALRADGCQIAVTERLLEPILRQRALDRVLTPDPLAALVAVRQRWRDQPAPVLDHAVELVIAERKAKVKPADIDDAVRRARRAADAAKAAGAAVDAARSGEADEPVWHAHGTAEFQAYVAAHPTDPLGKPMANRKGVRVRPSELARLGIGRAA